MKTVQATPKPDFSDWARHTHSQLYLSVYSTENNTKYSKQLITKGLNKILGATVKPS